MQTETAGASMRGPQEQYFSALAEGRFQIQRCAGCGAHQFFPRVLCMHCGATDLAWTEPVGAGTVYSFSIVRRKPEAGGDYNVALIDLDEGVRMMSRVDGVAPERLRIGMPVKARVLRDEGQALVVFVSAEAA
ncbi:Zn-ribbon domain-containing OB-fold protein [Achromobacter sp. NPDC058515]|uniref:Zn-ribbon domain-containing OB-fold protein n=1 Tax=Achromobacter sp. NPDC058515 TaxID=3346533 RepID=UPI0036572D6B